jgi:hypothetical protein
MVSQLSLILSCERVSLILYAHIAMAALGLFFQVSVGFRVSILSYSLYGAIDD